MPRSRLPATRKGARSAGFTLLELLLVLALLSVIAGLVVAYLPARSTRTDVMASAREVASGLRRARSAAIASNASVPFIIDLKNRSYRIGAAAPVRLAVDIALTLDVANTEVAGNSVGGVRFFPDGSATGGRIGLRGTGGRAAATVVTVDWVTGRVDVSE